MRFTMPSRFTGALCLFVAACSTGAQVVDAQRPVNKFVAEWPAMCKGMVARAFSSQELRKVLELAPISESTICGCIDARMRSDTHLGPIFTVNDQQLRSRFDNEKFRPYLMGRMFSYSMSCIGTELEQSTARLAPVGGG